MLRALAVSLALTLLLELAFAYAWGLRERRELGLAVLVNCLTNPPVVLLHGTAVSLLGWPALPVTAVLELGAVLMEGGCYRAFSNLRRPFLFSLLANAFSFTTGCFLHRLLAGF